MWLDKIRNTNSRMAYLSAEQFLGDFEKIVRNAEIYNQGKEIANPDYRPGSNNPRNTPTVKRGPGKHCFPPAVQSANSIATAIRRYLGTQEDQVCAIFACSDDYGRHLNCPSRPWFPKSQSNERITWRIQAFVNNAWSLAMLFSQLNSTCWRWFDPVNIVSSNQNTSFSGWPNQCVGMHKTTHALAI